MRFLANFNYPTIQMAFPIERQLIFNRKLWDCVSLLSVWALVAVGA